jgi:hypothetical protein
MGIRVLALVSGGLDGELACRLLEAQGAEVERVHFRTGFARPDHARRLPQGTRRLDVRRDYLEHVVLDPEFGYGKAMNPCQDCRIYMLREAGRLAAELGADVVATGEVVGKGRRTGTRAALRLAEQRAGLEDRLLRPLSARHLPATAAEREGRLDRGLLGEAQGRSRREQLRLAERFGLSGFATPSGGCCRLADPAYARRLRDWLEHGGSPRHDLAELELLAVGRHLRVSWRLKLVVARDAADGEAILRLAGGRFTALVANGAGAVVLVDPGGAGRGEHEPDPGHLEQAAAVAARYSRERDAARVDVRLSGPGEPRTIAVSPAEPERVRAWLI